MFRALKQFVAAQRQIARDTLETALVARLGPMDDMLGHSAIPLELGGFADVAWFSCGPADGVICATIELACQRNQIRNRLGRYELVIVTETRDDVAADLISKLGRYTLEARLEVGDTMEIGPAAPEGSAISALYFDRFGVLDGLGAGLLVCVGITSAELVALRGQQRTEVLDRLQRHARFPMTDWQRVSVC
jgi:Suppressor of fused protein (SUFU)